MQRQSNARDLRATCQIRIAIALCLYISCSGAWGQPPGSDEETVGHRGENRTVTPVNQVLTPLGLQVDLEGMRPQAIALSPNGAVLVATGKTSELVVIDPRCDSP